MKDEEPVRDPKDVIYHDETRMRLLFMVREVLDHAVHIASCELAFGRKPSSFEDLVMDSVANSINDLE